MRMLDPWRFALALLLGAYPAPTVHWPPERVHLVVNIGPDTEPDIELEPEPKAVQISPRDELVFEHITQSAGVSVRQTAAALGITREMVRRSLDRMRAVGRLEYDGEGWLAR